jgi:hypothetical protein
VRPTDQRAVLVVDAVNPGQELARKTIVHGGVSLQKKSRN